MTEEQRARLESRLQEIRECKTAQEVSYVIWTKALEKGICLKDSYRDSYRNAFVEWVSAYVEKRQPKRWYGYTTPKELAESIWSPSWDIKDKWFKSLRKELVIWIETYAKQAK